MAVIVNRNTAQNPMLTGGLTGAQVLKFIDAQRVYIKSPDSITAAPVGTYFAGTSSKSNGVTPAGWTDLGIITGKPKVAYTKKVIEVTTGIDKVFRSAYTNEKKAQLQFDLGQFDDVALQQVSGLSPSIITSGSVVAYQVGGEDLNISGLLLVAQNKLDGKEIQFYNPAAYLNFEYADNGDEMVLKCTAYLPYFTLTIGGPSMFMYQAIFA